MKALVLGGGIAGVTTAYFLGKDGHDVTLLEANEQLGLEATASNAGIIAPGHSFAWGSPKAPAMLWRSLLGQETAIRMRLKPDLALYTWGLKFLRECTAARARHNTLIKLALAQYSQRLLNEVAHAEPALSALRSVKEPAEIAAMEKAIAVAEKAIGRIIPRIKAGLNEKQIAAMLTQELLACGADSIAFGPVVSGGPNSASPHATPTNRAIRQGDLLVIDWGVYVDDYPSDLTRTFAVGPIDDELRRIYDVVRMANEEAQKAVRPGATGQMVDRVAREIIEDAGYGEYIIHRTGHGLGLEVHEPPDMSPLNDKPIVPGNVFTIEPGIYLPGRGGVRIEDNIVATDGGGRSMSSFTHDLITVG